MSIELTEDNFFMYAVKNYYNPACKGLSEFTEDIKRFRYLKRLFRKPENKKGFKERLILNHIVVLNNLFGPEHVTRMLFFKIEKKYWSELKTYLVFLNIMPVGIIIYYDGDTIPGYEIALDETLSNLLKII